MQKMSLAGFHFGVLILLEALNKQLVVVQSPSADLQIIQTLTLKSIHFSVLYHFQNLKTQSQN